MNYTVNISLPKTLADMAQEKVKRGHYTTLSEVVRTALRKLLIDDDIPVYRMSKKAEKRAEKAYQDYLAGRTKELKSLDDLDTL